MQSNSDIEVLSQIIDDENGHYRLRVGQRVHYLTIPSGTFDDDTMCRPCLLIPKLPPLPSSAWTSMIISQDGNGSLTSIISSDPLPEVESTWHETRINVLDLKRTRRFRSGVHEVKYQGAPAIAKIACFEWHIDQIQHETWAYFILTQHQSEHPGEAPIAPEFLGHLTENGRVIGFLLRKFDGEPARINDLNNCEALLRQLHSLGLIHGDVNRNNFLFDRVSGRAMRLIDFEHTEEFDAELAEAELLSLPGGLAEETGRGATVTLK